MKEQIKTYILPTLPIVGNLKLSTRDGKTLCALNITTSKNVSDLDTFSSQCFTELNLYLTGQAKKINIKTDDFLLTDFQKKVLQVMKAIPYGKVATYKDLAETLHSKAYQAIGSACGRNPLLLLYPCHRVVGSHDLGGFAHGLFMKKNLLRLEGFKFQ